MERDKKYLLGNLLFGKITSFIIIFAFLFSFCAIYIISPLYNIITGIVLVLSSIIMFVYLINFKISKFTLSVILYIAVLIFSTIISETADMYKLFSSYYKILALILYLDLGIKKHSKTIITSINYSYLVLVIINFITIIIFPQGMFKNSLYTDNWFFGYTNSHIFMFFPALVSSYIYYKYQNQKLSLVINLILITYSVYFCFSANSVVAYTLFLLYFALFNILKKINFLNAKNYFISFFIFYFCFIVAKIQNIFSWLIVNILHKNLTFTGRTIIWERVTKYIKERLFIGYGFESTATISNKLGNSAFTHAHNTILDITYKGGILNLFTFIIVLWIVVKELYKERDNSISKIVSFVLFCMFIMMTFEARQENIGLYIILFFGYNIKKIIGDIEIYREVNNNE